MERVYSNKWKQPSWHSERLGTEAALYTFRISDLKNFAKFRRGKHYGNLFCSKAVGLDEQFFYKKVVVFFF